MNDSANASGLAGYPVEPPRKRFYASSVFLSVGLLLTLLVVMFRPAGAEAVLPTSALVFDKYDATTGATVKFGDLPKITADYSVKLDGKKSASPIALTGVPLTEFLKATSADIGGVNFVKVRLGTNNDSSIALMPLDKESPRPAMVLDSGHRPGIGPFKTPALVPGQATDTPISERQIVPFNRRTQELTIIPAKPGAKMMSVRISSKRTRAGEYKLTAKATAGTSGGALKYEWYAGDTDGTAAVVSNRSTYTTTNARSGAKRRIVNVVVTETSTGSTGTRSFSYTSRKADDGKTSNPFPNSGGGGGSGPGSGGGSGGGVGGFPNGVFTPPSGNTTPPSTTTPVPATPQITPPPVTTPPVEPDPPVQSDQDTSAVTNVAQNISGVGGFKAVSGVLLSSPTIAPAGGGGAPIAELPAPVADELSSLFQPVEDPGDIWPYLLAILFATTLAGAIRESINP